MELGHFELNHVSADFVEQYCYAIDFYQDECIDLCSIMSFTMVY